MNKILTFILCAALLLVPVVSAITWTGGPGGGSGTSYTNYDIYFNSSNSDTISYNLSTGGKTIIDYWFVPGIKMIFGGDFA